MKPNGPVLGRTSSLRLSSPEERILEPDRGAESVASYWTSKDDSRRPVRMREQRARHRQRECFRLFRLPQ